MKNNDLMLDLGLWHFSLEDIENKIQANGKKKWFSLQAKLLPDKLINSMFVPS